MRGEEVDDVVQQTYAQALGAAPRARNLRGWLVTVLRNVVRRRRRDDATRARHEMRTPGDTPPVDPVEAVARAELHRRVVEALLALPDPYRATLVLRFFDDRSVEEIAAAQQVPVETVRTRVKRGLVRLREALQATLVRKGETLRGVLASLLAPAVAATKKTVVVHGAWKIALAAAGCVAAVSIVWSGQENGDATAGVASAVPNVAATTVRESPSEVAQDVETPLRATRRSTLPAGEETTPGAFSFEGRVVDRAGVAVAGARVLLVKGVWGGDASRLATVGARFLEDGDDLERRVQRKTKAAQDGKFRFDDVDPFGCFSVVAFDEFVGIGASAAPHQAGAEIAVVVLQPVVVVRGRVADGAGRPVPRTSAGFDFGSDEFHTVGWKDVPVRSDGAFLYVAPRPIGVLVPRAQSDDGRVARAEPLSFPDEAPLHRSVELVLREPELTCRGRIVDMSGVPLDLASALASKLTDWECADELSHGAQLYGLKGEKPPTSKLRLTDLVQFGNLEGAPTSWRIELTPDARWIALIVRDRVLGCVAAPAPQVGAGGPDLQVDSRRFRRRRRAPPCTSDWSMLKAVPRSRIAQRTCCTFDTLVEDALGQASVGVFRSPRHATRADSRLVLVWCRGARSCARGRAQRRTRRRVARDRNHAARGALRGRVRAAGRRRGHPRHRAGRIGCCGRGRGSIARARGRRRREHRRRDRHQRGGTLPSAGHRRGRRADLHDPFGERGVRSSHRRGARDGPRRRDACEAGRTRRRAWRGHQSRAHEER